MIKVNNLVERIFAHAVALDQNGGLKNTIYCLGSEIFILNYDHTVLMRFRLRNSEGGFESPLSFKANDYDSNVFEEVDGKIVFKSENNSYSRKKICGTSDLSPEKVKKLYSKYNDIEDRFCVEITKDLLDLLDESLSHVEFHGKEGGGLKIIQRNIYSGGIIEIEEKQEGLLKKELPKGISKIAIKTNDLKALFIFEDSLKFYFPQEKKENDNYIIIKSINRKKRDMSVVVACCLYDEIIQLKNVK